MIGLAALKYYLLSFTPAATVTFDPKKSIDFLGQTGPYCLYAFARVQSLLRKASSGAELPHVLSGTGEPVDLSSGAGVLKALQEFPAAFRWAATNGDTSKVADQTYRIAKAFSAFYNDKNHQIVGNPDAALGAARLHLAQGVANGIQAGLAALGIETLDRM